ncbi:acetoacetate--CoA ligase [uncultured Ruegeria sp.]|uniref:acetoacetate--CoA ligase n=1 Tax=uncultured Ruegeria sp. TaxID=259304 RepID=UPI00260A545F|nr:acetoacetate--CoA ligase [uncultured Ruegeria sp.]
MSEDILWTPTDASSTSLAWFAEACGFDAGRYDDLHRWSVSDKRAFWSSVWDFCEVLGEPGQTKFVSNEAAPMTGARFFPEARLNLAENLIERGADSDIAVCTADEAGHYAEVTRRALRQKVARVAKGLLAAGVTPGDRVAGIQGNTLDALVATLASLAVGAVWTSCSPDFGAAAIIDRIGQVAPKVLFASPNYRYGGKDHDISDRLAKVRRAVSSIELVVSSGGHMTESVRQEDFGSDARLTYARLAFDHPAYVLYTSGTTGAPKAIVHRAGGVLLQHLKEHVLHGDVRAGDRVIWYTNTAWMMYHWNISALAAGAAVVLYDGAPILKTGEGLDCARLWTLAGRAQVTHLGVSPKYLSTLAAEAFHPKHHHKLEALRALLVCGAPCLPHQFDWVYQAVKTDMMFASISGGTEILGSFLIGSPIHPVRRGQLTVPALGHAVAVLDDRGVPVIGQRGDLVCTEPFPSMPLTFWGDGGDQRYRDTYFGDRPEVWTHGDVAEMTHTGGGYVHGRSDNTLKPGGVRIGISEIYAVCETYSEVQDFLAFGADRDGDEEVVLAIQPVNGAAITPDLIRRIRGDIRTQASPRHVPARIHLVSAVPYTINGKRVEGAARTTVNGGTVRNLGSLANPECLKEFSALRREDAL